LFPPLDYFDDAILFLETSEVIPPSWFVEDELRWYGTMGILNQISGIFWGKPQGGELYDEYKLVIRKVLAEFGRTDLPVLYNGSFGHNEPKTLLPYGAMAEINCDSKTFTILESGVV
jgi:muramoyltetrapeptide carboxypeptidase LdcA involved in peptidoglycan recycling